MTKTNTFPRSTLAFKATIVFHIIMLRFIFKAVITAGIF